MTELVCCSGIGDCYRVMKLSSDVDACRRTLTCTSFDWLLFRGALVWWVARRTRRFGVAGSSFDEGTNRLMRNILEQGVHSYLLR